MEERDFKGIWIPKAVWLDKRLSFGEKCYLSIYLQYNRQENIATFLMRDVYSTGTIIQIRTKLRKLKLIDKNNNAEEVKELVLKRKNTGFTCEWCGCKTIAIQYHHYPIPKHKGGTKTVKICPNCHYEFHALFEDNKE